MGSYFMGRYLYGGIFGTWHLREFRNSSIKIWKKDSCVFPGCAPVVTTTLPFAMLYAGLKGKAGLCL